MKVLLIYKIENLADWNFKFYEVLNNFIYGYLATYLYFISQCEKFVKKYLINFFHPPPSS
jgi:hypothetical protein